MVWGDDRKLNLQLIFKGLLAVLVIMSVIAFITYGIDKRKAVRKKWRIPEATLLLLAFLGGGIGALLGMIFFHHKTRKWKFKILVPLFMILQLALLFFFWYTSDYYHADARAKAALASDGTVRVEEMNGGWLFDGPSEDRAFIFYPGGKVEAEAYAPLMHEMASAGVDTFLVKMPFNIAFFGMDRAADIMKMADYEHWYIGGHSLGGVAASGFAAGHEEELGGLILLAAYPAKEIDEQLPGIMIYGSEDHVLNMKAALKALDLWNNTTRVIVGGNHAGFGDYGAQKGDGTASITQDQQQAQTVQAVLESIRAWEDE